jgi:hypothetical protein
MNHTTALTWGKQKWEDVLACDIYYLTVWETTSLARKCVRNITSQTAHSTADTQQALHSRHYTLHSTQLTWRIPNLPQQVCHAEAENESSWVVADPWTQSVYGHNKWRPKKREDRGKSNPVEIIRNHVRQLMKSEVLSPAWIIRRAAKQQKRLVRFSFEAIMSIM